MDGKITTVIGSIFFVIMLAASCTVNKSTTGKDYSARYVSHPNSMAEINLELKENLRFEYFMVILPEQGGEQKMDTLIFKGRWDIENSQYVLTFHRRKKPDLFALLDSEYFPTTNVVIRDERRISFPLNAQEISIWGILCFRDGD
jgi:hypothetical protein